MVHPGYTAFTMTSAPEKNTSELLDILEDERRAEKEIMKILSKLYDRKSQKRALKNVFELINDN